MATNKQPIFVNTPKLSWATLAAANTAKDGTGTVATVFTAGIDGAFISKIFVRPLGTNVATVLRIFSNNGATNATPANNSLLYEVTLPATTVSEVAAQNDTVITLDLPLPAGYTLTATLGTTVAAGYQVSAYGGDY